MKIQINNFGGIAPRYDRKKLPANTAQTAINCDVSSGSLELFEGIGTADCGGTTPLSISPVTIAVPNPPTMVVNQLFDTSGITLYGQFVQTKYLTIFTQRIFHQESAIRTVKGFDITFAGDDPVTLAGLDSNWLYPDKGCRYKVTIDGTNIPDTISQNSKCTYGSIPLYSGTYAYANVAVATLPDPYMRIFRDSRLVGEIYPVQDLHTEYFWNYATDFSPIILRLNMNYTIPYNQYLYYRVTCEDVNGDEGPPSDISTQITRIPGDKITITFGGLTSVSGDSTPAKWHIYRAEHGTEDKDFFHLAEVDFGTTTYDDGIAVNSVLGRQLPLYRGALPLVPLWGNPTGSMPEVIQMSSMFYVGYKNKTIYFSDTKSYNHRWPSDFSITLDYDIVKIITSNDTVIVLTKGGCTAIYGDRPYEHFAKELSNRCCVSADAVAKIGENVFYISPDGLMRTNGHTAVLISKSHFMPADWRNLTPLTMTLTAQGDRLFVYTADSNAFNYIFDYDGKTVDIIQTERTDATFTATQMTWKSREYSFDKEQVFAVGRVLADSYTSINFKIYRNNVFAWEKQVSNNKAFILPRFDPHKYWAVEVIAKSTVHEIAIAQSEDEFFTKT